LAESGAPARPYHLVLVSDHGQSQGATFLQRYGHSLEQLVAEHLGEPPLAVADAQHEVRGSVRLMTSELAAQGAAGRVAAGLVSGATETRESSSQAKVDSLSAVAEPQSDRAPLTVIGSGNLGGIWLPGDGKRRDRAGIDKAHPGLLDALRKHPGIGFVVVADRKRVVALGADGELDLDSGKATGTNPLAPFADASADFARAVRFHSAPDIYVGSLYDARLDEVAAFEELVGCHGGVGGWQTRPLLVFPAAWGLDADLLDDQGRLYGADVVHQQLVRWLERLGHRKDLGT